MILLSILLLILAGITICIRGTGAKWGSSICVSPLFLLLIIAAFGIVIFEKLGLKTERSKPFKHKGGPSHYCGA